MVVTISMRQLNVHTLHTDMKTRKLAINRQNIFSFGRIILKVIVQFMPMMEAPDVFGRMTSTI